MHCKGRLNKNYSLVSVSSLQISRSLDLVLAHLVLKLARITSNFFGARLRVPAPGPGSGTRFRDPAPGPGSGTRFRDPVPGPDARRPTWELIGTLKVYKGGIKGKLQILFRLVLIYSPDRR